jgi:hypothetical protein
MCLWLVAVSDENVQSSVAVPMDTMRSSASSPHLSSMAGPGEASSQEDQADGKAESGGGGPVYAVVKKVW